MAVKNSLLAFFKSIVATFGDANRKRFDHHSNVGIIVSMVMKYQMHLTTQDVFSEINFEPSYIQDTIHTVLKLRNRLLKVSVLLPMGNKQVSVTHLKLLINRTSKDIHGLVLKDVCTDDKQNFKSLQKLMEKRVSDALISNVPDNQATVMFIQLCSFIESALNDLDMLPVERIKKIWFAVFFLRIWKKSIIRSTYSLDDNWITSNAYICVEINVHSLIQLIQKMREKGEDELFMPIMYSSQACEQAFRQLRSMTTMNWTKVNFTMLELTHMISRLELQNEIIHLKLNDFDIDFPRISRKTEKFKHYTLPSDQEIELAMNGAKNEALAEALKFGMNIPSHEISNCDINEVNINENPAVLDDSCDETDELMVQIDSNDPFEFDDDDDALLSGVLEQDLCLRDYSDQVDQLGEDSRFTKITDKRGFSKVVRKSSIVWLLSNSKGTLSSDRLQRVQASKQKSCKRRLNFQHHFIPYGKGRLFFKAEELHLGQWAFFKEKSKSKRSENSEKTNDYIVSNVMGFVYSKGKNQKEKQYSWEFAAVAKDNIEVLTTWYRLQPNGEFIMYEDNNSFYVPISNYVMSMQPPDFDTDPINATCNLYIPKKFSTKENIQDSFAKMIKINNLSSKI